MSALLSLGEAQHKLLNADTELGALQVTSASADVTAALARTRKELAVARATIAAVQLVLRGQDIAKLATHHEKMAADMHQAARGAKMPVGFGLHQVAERHERHAKVIRTLIGPVLEVVPPPAATEGGRE